MMASHPFSGAHGQGKGRESGEADGQVDKVLHEGSPAGLAPCWAKPA